jgi:hypothetical protein
MRPPKPIRSDNTPRSRRPAVETLAGYPLAEALVRPTPLVVIDIFAQHIIQMVSENGRLVFLPSKGGSKLSTQG